MALKVIALISGGKDSMYSMLHCETQGHRIMALANLYPPPPVREPDAEDQNAVQDLNSFMFQTVGHTIIPLYEKALGLPLFRRQITGVAQHTSKEYTPGAVAGDETEDIFALLSEVRKAHPEANAVSTGAILSTYQRTRVESVALRLGLVPLGYLWQYPNLPTPDPSSASLLRHMAASSLDARIIKVASGGLDESFLWQNLCEARTTSRVQRAVDRFGGSVLGEGGEFETLVVEGPPPLWKGKIVVSDSDMTTIKAEGGEAFLSFSSGSSEAVIGDVQSYPLEIPALFDISTNQWLAGEGVVKAISQLQQPAAGLSAAILRSVQQDLSRDKFENKWLVYLNNITCPRWSDSASKPSRAEANGISYQTADTCSRLKDRLAQNDLDTSDVVHTTILLRTMSDFSTVNEIYSTIFQHALPPSRVTIACGGSLPPDMQISISAIATREPSERKGLHVQTRSYWAPANIGPYSQARSIGSKGGCRLVFVAGQIPLIPASMEPYKPEDKTLLQQFAESAALSLQHLWRIGVDQQVGYWSGAVAYISSSEDFEARARVARELWKAAHSPPEESDDDETADVDVWDLRNRSAQTHVRTEDVRPLPDYKRTEHHMNQETIDAKAPGFFAVEVAELPRGCGIEWQSVGLSSPSDDVGYSIEQGTVLEDGRLLHKASFRPVRGAFDRLVHCTHYYIEVPMGADLAAYRKGIQGDSLVTIYASPRFQMWSDLDAETIPCSRVQGLTSEGDLLAGIVVRYIPALGGA